MKKYKAGQCFFRKNGDCWCIFKISGPRLLGVKSNHWPVETYYYSERDGLGSCFTINDYDVCHQIHIEEKDIKDLRKFLKVFETEK